MKYNITPTQIKINPNVYPVARWLFHRMSCKYLYMYSGLSCKNTVCCSIKCLLDIAIGIFWSAGIGSSQIRSSFSTLAEFAICYHMISFCVHAVARHSSNSSRFLRMQLGWYGLLFMYHIVVLSSKGFPQWTQFPIVVFDILHLQRRSKSCPCALSNSVIDPNIFPVCVEIARHFKRACIFTR